MASFLSGVSDAFDAISSNLLPFYERKQETEETKAAAAYKTAEAQATVSAKQASAKMYAAVAVAAVSAVALLIIIKKRRS